MLTLPHEYKSSTTLAVTSPSMTTDVVKSSPADLAERVRAISHELLSRPVLEQVVRDEGLGRRRVDGRRGRRHSWTSVGLAAEIAGVDEPFGPRHVSRHVCRSYARRKHKTSPTGWRPPFIEQHSKLRETRAEDTSAFLAAQLGQSRDRLKTVEERLRQVKEAYMGRLPEQTQANLQMVGGLRQQQESTTMSLRSEQDRLAMLERQIEADETEALPKRRCRKLGARRPRIGLSASARQLDEAAAMYTDKHPEIQRLKGEIASAETLAEAERKRAGG